MPFRRLIPRLANLLGLLALGFLLSASECRNDLTILPPADPEICGDGVDNDGNGKLDCRDDACANPCRPELEINPVAEPVTEDSVELTGTCTHAASITVSVSPSGSGDGGLAKISGSDWAATLRNLQNGTLTATVVAVDSTGKWRDTAKANFGVLRL